MLLSPQKAPLMSKVRPNFINTTSKAVLSWQKQFSPFFVGPIPLYWKNMESKCMENAWQFGKAAHLEAQFSHA